MNLSQRTEPVLFVGTEIFAGNPNFQVMVHSKRNSRGVEVPFDRHILYAPNRTRDRQTSRLASRSFPEGLHLKTGVALSSESHQSEKLLKAGSSSDHAKQNLEAPLKIKDSLTRFYSCPVCLETFGNLHQMEKHVRYLFQLFYGKIIFAQSSYIRRTSRRR